MSCWAELTVAVKECKSAVHLVGNWASNWADLLESYWDETKAAALAVVMVLQMIENWASQKAVQWEMLLVVNLAAHLVFQLVEE